jgi:geranylgeranyl reductase family protein
MRVDVAVVGAGVAGCMVAGLLAKDGYNVALIELKAEEEIGEKVCGDGVGRQELERVGYIPKSEDVECRVKGIRFYNNRGGEIFTIIGEGYTLNRKNFGQTLLRRAQDSGVILHDKNLATTPLIMEGGIIGFEAKDLHSHQKREFKASLTIDASGIATSLRRRLPPNWWPSEKTPSHALGLGYREIRKADGAAIDHCNLYYDWSLAPGGYFWIIPKGESLCNIGILTSPPTQHPTNLKRILKRFADSNPLLKGSNSIEEAFGIVPMTVPLSCPVWNGFLTIGDAANHPNPFNGGGIGPALEAAKIAAEATSKALSLGIPTMERLWAYPKAFMKTRGAKHATSSILKDLMHSLTNDHVQRLLGCFGIKGEYTTTDFLKEMSTMDKICIFARMVRTPRLLLGTAKAIKTMRKTKGHYKAYPNTPSNFLRWIETPQTRPM